LVYKLLVYFATSKLHTSSEIPPQLESAFSTSVFAGGLTLEKAESES